MSARPGCGWRATFRRTTSVRSSGGRTARELEASRLLAGLLRDRVLARGVRALGEERPQPGPGPGELAVLQEGDRPPALVHGARRIAVRQRQPPPTPRRPRLAARVLRPLG